MSMDHNERKIDWLSPAADQADDRDHDDGAQQCHQHGWNIDRLVDRIDMDQGGNEPASQECAYDGHNDVDQQTSAIMHDFRR
jgi:hypothetical protein